MDMKRIFLGFVGILCLFGCSTVPVPLADAIPVPAERLLAYQDIGGEQTATIVVVRDSGFAGSACYLAFSIDGVLAARLNVGETARFFVRPGERLLQVGQDPFARGVCSIRVEFGVARETQLRENETKHFRTVIDQSGTFDIRRVN